MLWESPLSMVPNKSSQKNQEMAVTRGSIGIYSPGAYDNEDSYNGNGFICF